MADVLTRYRAALYEAITHGLETWRVNDPLSPFVGDVVVSRSDVLAVINVAFIDARTTKPPRKPRRRRKARIGGMHA